MSLLVFCLASSVPIADRFGLTENWLRPLFHQRRRTVDAVENRCIMAHCPLRASPERAQEGLVDVFLSVGSQQEPGGKRLLP